MAGPPSVVSTFQINAADERRGLFPVDRIVPAGLSDDGRFLSVDVAGAHSDVGGSYLSSGLGAAQLQPDDRSPQCPVQRPAPPGWIAFVQAHGLEVRHAAL